MGKMKNIYREHINGVIGTLVVHIIVFALLIQNGIGTKKEMKEPVIVIDFAEEIEVEKPKPEPQKQKSKQPSEMRSNMASNKMSDTKNDEVDDAFMKEVEAARQRSAEMKKRLAQKTTEIKIPVVKNDASDKKTIEEKQYTGDSNIEYFLENRYHIQLAIPVYLAQQGGQVEVEIFVDNNGKVIEANVDKNVPSQLRKFAKQAALSTSFNVDKDAANPQKGRLIYRFIAQ